MISKRVYKETRGNTRREKKVRTLSPSTELRTRDHSRGQFSSQLSRSDNCNDLND